LPAFQELKGNFNLCPFIDALKKVDPKFAIDVKKFCEKDKWFEYFLNLRNPEARTGKITPFPFIKLKAVRNMKVKLFLKNQRGNLRTAGRKGASEICCYKR
jgi:hypothetical protein